MPSDRKISFIGFGEAAQAFAQGLRREDSAMALRAFDIKTNGPEAPSLIEAYDRHGVTGCDTSKEVCAEVDAIFSLVTAEQAEAAASEAAKADLGNSFFFDANSCAPETKKRSAQVIEAARGRYVDVAIMTPVHPKLHQSPCLISGPHADVASAVMADLGMRVKIVGAKVGDASTRKMIRSTMVKGLEAVTLECFLAAQKAGISDEILHSLDTSYPGLGWPERASYMVERSMTHGNRRAAEMREVVKTLRDLGVAPDMTTGTVAWHSRIGALDLDAQEIGADNLAALIDAVMKALDMTERGQQ